MGQGLLQEFQEAPVLLGSLAGNGLEPFGQAVELECRQ